RRSTNVVEVAGFGPLLVTLKLYVILSPNRTGSPAGVAERARSTGSFEKESMPLLLFAVFRSTSVPVTEAQLLMTPSCWGLTVTVTTRKLPGGIGPTEQRTSPAALEQEPESLLAETNWAPVGSTSLTMEPL